MLYLIYRVFNVVIPRPTEEPGSEWLGSNIEEGQQIFFQIAALDLYGALPYIRGKIDERYITTVRIFREIKMLSISLIYVSISLII